MSANKQYKCLILCPSEANVEKMNQLKHMWYNAEISLKITDNE